MLNQRPAFLLADFLAKTAVFVAGGLMLVLAVSRFFAERFLAAVRFVGGRFAVAVASAFAGRAFARGAGDFLWRPSGGAIGQKTLRKLDRQLVG